jgi:thiol-disulfide isomerase/thioredoxin
MSIISITRADDTSALIKLKECMSSGKVCVLYYADWCGYCQQLKPEWTRMKELLMTSHHNHNLKHKFDIAEVESAAVKKLKEMLMSGSSDMSRLVQIQGYPTISMYENGSKVADYDGERNAEAMVTNISNTFQTNTSSNKQNHHHKNNKNQKSSKNHKNNNNNIKNKKKKNKKTRKTRKPNN